MHATAILSMLHEPPELNSAARLFRGRPALAWTLDRITRAASLRDIAILCWEDQLAGVVPLAEEAEAYILAKGPRTRLPDVEIISAARRWSQGWRGGLMATAEFDLGFHGPWVLELAGKLASDAVVLVNPAAGLVDPALLDALVKHSTETPSAELCFVPAAPGLAGALLRRPLLERLAAARAHGGRLLHYLPNQLSREPLAGDGCVAVAAPVARSTARFTLDSDRQIALMSAAMTSLNGHLSTASAEELVGRVQAFKEADPAPREVVIELNTARATSATFRPKPGQLPPRGPLSASDAAALFRELGSIDDLRLTLGGAGDPLLFPGLFAVIDAARNAGIVAIHVETDLMGIEAATVRRLAATGIDAVSVHLPACTAATYQAVMGRDGYAEVVENIRVFVTERRQRESGLPIVIPVFTKCRANLAEMEKWYDQWLGAVGSAVVTGASDFGGLIPDTAVADMAPPGRKPCLRLASRLTVLCDSRVATCEQDARGEQALGEAGTEPISHIWQERFEALRSEHRKSNWDRLPVCSRCREWHRP